MKTFKQKNLYRQSANIEKTIQLNAQESKIYPDDYAKKERIDKAIREGINDSFFDVLKKPSFSDEDKENITNFIADYIKNHQYFFTSAEDHTNFIENIVDDIFGFGVVQKYLQNPEIQEIFIEGRRGIFYESNGARYKSPVFFKDDNAIKNVINKILSPINRKADESTPIVDARLPDGSRVAITLPPVALNGPTVNIRKFKNGTFSLNDYVRTNSMCQEMADFLSLSVKGGLNILVAGGTGSGKTTLLNALSMEIPYDLKNTGKGLEHIVTIEDSAELMIPQPFVSSWETKNKNSEGFGEITPSDLLKHALRNAPDRIILGEMRDKVAYDVLQAVNTGHEGTMSTIHCDDSARAVTRFSDLAASYGIITALQAQKSFAESFDLIVFVDKFYDDETKKFYRKVTQITYIAGMGQFGFSKLKLKSEVIADKVYLQDLFVYDKIKRQFECKGFFPAELNFKLKTKGYHYPQDILKKFKKPIFENGRG